jgi:hypothetical protein
MEGADDLLQAEELGDDQPVLPAVATPKAIAVRAVKKNDWALRSVLKGDEGCRKTRFTHHVAASKLIT